MREIASLISGSVTADASFKMADVSGGANNRSISTQLLYSYKINPQTLFFLGYSDQGEQDDDLSKIQRTDRTQLCLADVIKPCIPKIIGNAVRRQASEAP